MFASLLVHVDSSSSTALITNPLSVLAVLLLVLAGLFTINEHPTLKRVFAVVPLLVFAYFVPTLLSNTGVIPLSSPLYVLIKKQLLPASLLLLVLSVDVVAIAKLGRQAVGMFISATLGIVVGGPLAYLALGRLMPSALGEQTWKGLAAIAGSWIGGGANFVAIGESVGANDSTLSMMVVVDVAVANVWMAVLLHFAGRDEAMDRAMGADRSAIDALRQRIAAFVADVEKVASLGDLLAMLALAFGTTAAASFAASQLPPMGNIVREFTWIVIIVTGVGVALSFTRARRLEGAGASKIGSVFLYLLVASIGAHAEFRRVLDAPALLAIGALWMTIHAATLLLVRRLIKAPIFFAAVGSQANVGGAASAPIVAAAFHPALAPVGILLAVGGYVLGTYAGLLCAALLEQVHHVIAL